MPATEDQNDFDGAKSKGALGPFHKATRALAVMLTAAGSAVAVAEEQSWSPFRDDAGTYNSTTDRQYARQWEANPPRGYPTLSRTNIAATKAAIAKYRQLVKAGGWPKLPKVKLMAGDNHKAVAILRQRLKASGDLRANPTFSTTHFDYYLQKAVRRYQASNGLAPTGIVNKRTRAAMNVTAKERLKQLRINLSRLRSFGQSKSRRYVVVNIPAAQIEAVDGGRVVSRHAGVVGKVDRRTPILRAHIHELNFNPNWILPPTVIKKDLIPKGREMQRRKQDVLKKYGIDAYTMSGRKMNSKKINWASGQPYTLRYKQKAGKDNPLGFLKINFHNAHSVYLHDTPRDSIFGRNFRAASSGCVRVQNIEILANWLLRGQNGWSKKKIDSIKKSGDRKNVRLKKRTPLLMVYITAWATEDGVVQFRRDLYRKDGISRLASAY